MLTAGETASAEARRSDPRRHHHRRARAARRVRARHRAEPLVPRRLHRPLQRPAYRTPPYQMAQAILGLKAAYEKAQAGASAGDPRRSRSSPRSRHSDLRERPAARSRWRSARGTRPCEETVYGTAKRVGASSRFSDVKRLTRRPGEPAGRGEERRLDQGSQARQVGSRGSKPARRGASGRARVPMRELLAVVIDGAIYASWLFIIAVGLTIDLRRDEASSTWRTAASTRWAPTPPPRWSARGSRGGHAPLGSYAMLCWRRSLVGLIIGPLHRARLAALHLRQGRDRAGARHLRALPDPRGRDQAGLGRRVVLHRRSPTGCSATVEIGPLSYPVYSFVLVRGGDRGRHRRSRWGLHGTRLRQAAARGDPRPRDERRAGHRRARRLPRHLHRWAPCWPRSAARSRRRPSRSCRAWASR